MRNPRLIRGILPCVLLAAMACGDSSTGGPSTPCEVACATIEDACNSTEPDCAPDCEDDLQACPTEMQAVLDCIGASVLQCDPQQDQGLAEAPCQAEHAALDVCGADAF